MLSIALKRVESAVCLDKNWEIQRSASNSTRINNAWLKSETAPMLLKRVAYECAV